MLDKIYYTVGAVSVYFLKQRMTYEISMPTGVSLSAFQPVTGFCQSWYERCAIGGHSKWLSLISASIILSRFRGVTVDGV
jgi:hypothetical protein